jgi:hypothetical protein
MKKLLLISLLLGIIFHISSGQNEKPITKGNFLSGGSFSFDIEKNKDYQPISGTSPRQIYITDTKTFETDFYFGYFVVNHLVLGFKTDIIVLSYKHSFNLDNQSSKYSYHDLSLGPLIRYYTNSGIFFESSAAIGLQKNGNDGDFNKWRNFSFDTGIGYSLFVTKSIAIEPKIKYKYLNRPPYDIEDSTEIKSGLDFSIGFQIYLSTIKQE